MLNSYSLAIIFWIASFLAMTLNPVAVRHCEQSEAIQKLNKTPLIYQINNAEKFNILFLKPKGFIWIPQGIFLIKISAGTVDGETVPQRTSNKKEKIMALLHLDSLF